MTPNVSGASRWRTISVLVVLAVLLVAAAVMLTSTRANAIATAVPLGTADDFAVLGGESVTNTGPSVVTGDLGVNPGTSVTGFPPGIVNGEIHAADAVARQAQTDLTTAYNRAAGQAPDASLPPDAGGLTLAPGVYNASSTLGLTGTLTLDAGGDPNAVWVIQVGSSLTTASASSVSLINGAQACNVFWQIGSSATLGTATDFVGNILALTSITANTGASIDGRALARNGSVTMDTNTITRSTCGGETTGGETTGGGGTGGTTGGETTGGETTGGETTGGGGTGGTTGGETTGGETTGGETTGGETTGGEGTGGTTGGDGKPQPPEDNVVAPPGGTPEATKPTPVPGHLPVTG